MHGILRSRHRTAGKQTSTENLYPVLLTSKRPEEEKESDDWPVPVKKYQSVTKSGFTGNDAIT
jgi:hypothetical protein